MDLKKLDSEQALAVLLNVEIRSALEDLHCSNPEELPDSIMKQINIAIRNVSYGVLRIAKEARKGHRSAQEYVASATRGIEIYWEAPELVPAHARVLSKDPHEAWIE